MEILRKLVGNKKLKLHLSRYKIESEKTSINCASKLFKQNINAT